MLAERDYQLERHAQRARRRAQDRSRSAQRTATTGSRSSTAVDRFRADIAQLEAQLAAAIEERTKLQREIGTMKRDTESTWAAERVENALLRERINDVAAEVARLTATLEGPGSPIESMLAVDAVKRRPQQPRRQQRGEATGGRKAATPQENKNTLADRIRALQSTASRVASTN